MLLDDVATYLAANSTRFTVGVNLTKGYMPATPSTVTTLYETAGFAPLHTFTTSGAGRALEQPGLMIHARSTDYQTARNNVEAAFTLLDGIGNTTALGGWYGSITAVQSPFDIGQDQNDRSMLSVNFTIRKTTG